MSLSQNTPHLIVMLTHNDQTVANPDAVFEQCKHSQAQFFGIKDGDYDLPTMKNLFDKMKKHNKTTVLEVVQYDEAGSLAGAKMALACGADLLMGTCFFESVNAFCQQNQMKYLPFVGKIEERPSVLSGTIESMIEQARSYKEKGVYGIDLLGYRYVGDAEVLNEQMVKNVDLPIVIAGSIDSHAKLDEMKRIAPFAFTIGSAFFDGKFGDDIAEQINHVCEYLRK